MSGKASGTSDLAAQQFDLYEVWAWIMRGRKGFEQVQKLREEDHRIAEKTIISMLEGLDPERSALVKLKVALANGKVLCHANGEAGPSGIPRGAWASLDFSFPPPEARDRESARGFPWGSLQFPGGQVVAQWPSPMAGNAGRKPGRPKGSGKIDDDRLLDDMHELIEKGEKNNPHAAAVALVEKAVGAGGDASKIKRLTRKFAERYLRQ